MRILILSSAILIASPALAERVTVTGCPIDGVEVGCVVLKGDDGKSYNISSAKPKPRIGAKAIKLTGDTSDKVSTCMQGTVLDNIKYEETAKDCTEATTK